MEKFFYNLKKQPLFFISLFLFLGFSIWWVYINFFLSSATTHDKQLFAACYQILALFGAIIGFLTARHWGGYKSLLGQALVFLSLGLLLQSFGQSVYSYYIFFKKIEIPYPSIGDIGFFGSIIPYIYGVVILSRISGTGVSLKKIKNKVWIFLVPLIILFVVYFFFLRGYEFDWSSKLRIFLDFGYPFGQAIYVSIAILALLFSRNFLGGILKKPIIFLIIALIVQYIADFTFLYQANAGTWYVGGINDYLYCTSYFLMTLAVIYIGNTFQKIRSENLATIAVRPEGGSSNDKLFNQILVEIIKRQTRVGGRLAWEQVRKVRGITINDEETVNVSIAGEPKETINQLVDNYRNLFGDIAVEVSKSAVRYLIAELPDDQLPESLK
ncbi:MAG: hypothetical protein WCG28_01040 [bacterium]